MKGRVIFLADMKIGSFEFSLDADPCRACSFAFVAMASTFAAAAFGTAPWYVKQRRRAAVCRLRILALAGVQSMLYIAAAVSPTRWTFLK